MKKLMSNVKYCFLLVSALMIISTMFYCKKSIEDGSGNGGGNNGGGTTTGQALFWIQSDLACGTITVLCNGISKSITGFFSGGAPACGTDKAATFEFEPGTYSYSASCSGLTWNGSITILAGNCTKLQLTGPTPGGGGNTTGQAMFWLRSDLGCGVVTVVCNGTSNSITSYSSAGAPACGTSGAATFTFAPGTYAYTASCSGKTWSGNVTVSAGNCFKMELTGGSSGGGGSANGKVMFWTSRGDLGPLTITLNDQPNNETVYTATIIGTLTKFFTSAPQSCDVSGGITVSRRPGIYGYFVEDKNKKRIGGGNITINATGCLRFELK